MPIRIPLRRGNRLAARYVQLIHTVSHFAQARETLIGQGGEPLVYSQNREITIINALMSRKVRLRREVIDRMGVGESYDDYIERCDAENLLTAMDIQWLSAGSSVTRHKAIAHMAQVINARDPTSSFLDHYTAAGLRECNALFDAYLKDLASIPDIALYLPTHWFSLSRADDARWVAVAHAWHEDIPMPPWERARSSGRQLVLSDIQLWKSPPIEERAP